MAIGRIIMADFQHIACGFDRLTALPAGYASDGYASDASVAMCVLQHSYSHLAFSSSPFYLITHCHSKRWHVATLFLEAYSLSLVDLIGIITPPIYHSLATE